MNKFSGPINGNEDSDYRLVVDKIRDLVEKIQNGNPLEQADGWMRKNHYSKKKIEIQRLSGDPLQMEQCYINLELVEMQREGKSTSQKLSSPFSLSSRLNVETPDEDIRIELSELFKKRKLRDGQMKEPRRILIRGRAGVGKTTLCKKIVHDFTYKGVWSNIFNRVVWIPLRRLKTLHGSHPDLGDLLKHIFFEQHANGSSLSDAMRRHLEDTKPEDTLFLLDGLDEVAEILFENVHGNSHQSHDLLIKLLERPSIIITTRPQTKLPSDFGQPDIELDTIGFSPNQVQEYITKVLENSPEKPKAIQSYLRTHKLMQSLVRIPIQLDALCMTWETSSTRRNPKDIPETMTAVYKDISENLWRKDLVRLAVREASTIAIALSAEIENLASPYSILLENLAFEGLRNNVIEFQTDHLDTVNVYQDVEQPSLKMLLGEIFERISFLRTSDSSKNEATRSYHFIHLTFQEYFAAKYFVRKWKAENLQHADSRYPSPKPVDMSYELFFERHKYTARYDIMWRFVAGLLDAEGVQHSIRFFEAMETGPVDLLGPAHQRLVMHCLSEAVALPEKTRANREARLRQWVLFEHVFMGSSFQSFASDPELPERVFFDAFSTLRSMELLKSVQYSGGLLSNNILSTLVELLEEEDRDIRHSAVDVLMNEPELSDPAMAALMRLINNQDEDISRRVNVVRALGSKFILLEEEITALVRLLNNQDEDIYVRRSVARALGSQSTLSEETITALERLVNDEPEDELIRSYAVEALGNQPTLSKQVIDALLQFLEISYIVPSASEALSKQSTLAQTTMTTLVSFLKHKNQETRSCTGRILNGQSELSQETVAALKRLFKDDDGKTRFSVGRDLGSKSGLSETMITALVELFRDDDWKVQCSVAAALGGRSTLSEVDTKTINSTLVELLAHQDKDVRSSAAAALGYQSILTETASKALIKLLDDEDWNVQHSAAEALGRQSTLTDSVLVVLLETFKSHGGHHQLSAVEVLDNQSELSERAMMAFEKLLRAKDKNIRHAAACASERHPTLTLVNLLKHDDSETRDLASQALDNRTNLSEPITTALARLLESPDSELKWFAAHSLCNQSTLSQPTVTAVIKLLKDRNEDLQKAARYILRKQSITEESSLYLINELLESQDSTPAQRYSAAAIAETNPLIVSEKVMTNLLKDEDRAVQLAAQQCLLNKSTLKDSTITDLVEQLKSSNILHFVAEILHRHSTLSVALLKKFNTALLGLLTEMDKKSQLNVVKAIGVRRNLMDNMLEAIGLSISSDTQAEIRRPMVQNLQFMEILYASLLYRSFNEQYSLYIDGDRCIINQQSGLRTAVLGSADSFRTSISKAQVSLSSMYDCDPWAPSESEDIQQPFWGL